MKERYLDSDIVEQLVYPENTLLSMLEKSGDTGMVGDKMPIPVFYGNPQGVGGAFTSAQANASNTKSVQFDVEAGNYFGVVYIGDKVLQASRTNQGAFLANKMVEMDGLYTQAGDSLSAYCWGNGGQAIGQLATLSTNDFTLVQPEQIANFEVGMTLVASANDGATATDSLRDNGDSTTLASILRSTGGGALASAAAISGLAAGDYLFRQSDFFGDQSIVVIKGVQTWCAATDAPGALWGVAAATRALDPQRLGGCRVDPLTIAGKTYEEKIKILLAQMTGRFKAKKPTAGFLHPEDFQVLETLMAARGVRPMEDENTKFGFAKIDVMTGSGRMPIYTDRHCPRGTFFALRMEDWGIGSIGEMLHPQMGDGLEILRVYNSTDYEFRLISYPLLYNRAPKNSGRCSLVV